VAREVLVKSAQAEVGEPLIDHLWKNDGTPKACFMSGLIFSLLCYTEARILVFSLLLLLFNLSFPQLRDAIRREDHNLVCDLLRMAFVLILGSGGKHYPKIIASYLKTVSSHPLGQKLVQNAIVNPRGIPGHGVAVDQYLEHQILMIKTFLKAGQSLGTVKKLTVLTPMLAGIRGTIKEELGMQSSSSHTKPNRDEDVKTVVKILKSQKLLDGSPTTNCRNPFVVAGEKMRNFEDWSLEEHDSEDEDMDVQEEGNDAVDPEGEGEEEEETVE